MDVNRSLIRRGVSFLLIGSVYLRLIGGFRGTRYYAFSAGIVVFKLFELRLRKRGLYVEMPELDHRSPKKNRILRLEFAEEHVK